MSEYTIVNLKAVEDQAEKFGISPDLEARFARVDLEAELVGVTYLRLAPNFRIPWGHTHKTQEEVYVLLSGSARAKLGGEVRELEPWDALRMHKDTMRGLEAGPGGGGFPAIRAPG